MGEAPSVSMRSPCSRACHVFNLNKHEGKGWQGETATGEAVKTLLLKRRELRKAESRLRCRVGISSHLCEDHRVPGGKSPSQCTCRGWRADRTWLSFLAGRVHGSFPDLVWALHLDCKRFRAMGRRDAGYRLCDAMPTGSTPL